jgi:hypothetical protein
MLVRGQRRPADGGDEELLWRRRQLVNADGGWILRIDSGAAEEMEEGEEEGERW